MVIGAFVALFFLGLPLAIIGLFIASANRKARGFVKAEASPEPAPPASVANHDSDRRRIVYGRYSVVTTGSAERHEQERVHNRKA